MSDDVHGVRPDVLCGPLISLFGDGRVHGRALLLLDNRQRAGDDQSKARVAASLSTRICSTAPCRRRSALVRPSEPELRPGLGRIEVGRGRDQADARSARRQATRSSAASRRSPRASPPAGHACAVVPALDVRRPMSPRCGSDPPSGRRSGGEVRCAQTTDGSAASVASMPKAASVPRCPGGARRSRPASEPRDQG